MFILLVELKKNSFFRSMFNIQRQSFSLPFDSFTCCVCVCVNLLAEKVGLNLHRGWWCYFKGFNQTNFDPREGNKSWRNKGDWYSVCLLFLLRPIEKMTIAEPEQTFHTIKWTWKKLCRPTISLGFVWFLYFVFFFTFNYLQVLEWELQINKLFKSMIT